MSINIPGIPRAINLILLQMANVDFIPHSYITESLFPQESEIDNNDSALNKYFE
jgi:hypothetical protein